MPNARTLLIELTVIVAIGVLLALLGPFGSFESPLADRLVYWLGLGVGGYLIFRPIMTAAATIADRLDLPEAGAWIAGLLLAAMPMSLLVWAVAPVRPAGPPTLGALLAVYTNVLIVGAVVTLVYWFVSRGERKGTRSAPAQLPLPLAGDAGPTPAFLGRLPPHLGRELLALEMEDHYVRAHTAAGSTLILLRLRDAVTELAGVDGMQVHRSWWVARGAVERPVIDGRNVRLKLKGGIEAPVARNSVEALRAAGWLD